MWGSGLSDECRDGFADIIWSQGEEILQDTGRLRAYLADCVSDRSKRDVLFLAITGGIANDIRQCSASDFALRKLTLRKKQRGQ